MLASTDETSKKIDIRDNLKTEGGRSVSMISVRLFKTTYLKFGYDYNTN